MDPISWITAGTQLLGAVGGLQQQNAMPGMASSGNAPVFATSDQDFSGFTVATGQAKAYGATIDKTDGGNSAVVPSTLGQLQDAMGGVSPVLVFGIAIAAAVVWRMVKK